MFTCLAGCFPGTSPKSPTELRIELKSIFRLDCKQSKKLRCENYFRGIFFGLNKVCENYSYREYGNCLADSYNYFYIPVYIDASTDCNNLEFVFGQTAVGVTTLATRSITIKASQLACGDSNLAPSGCSQYYWGTGGASTIKSFGYDGSTSHLADQAQTICVRRESGKI